MKKTIITKDIEVNPKYLDKNIKNHIKTLLQQEKQCFLTHGYIDEIIDVLNISSINISPITNYPVFRVQFTANTFLPEIDKIVVVQVKMIFQQGIFMEYGNIIIMIPQSELTNFTFCPTKKEFKNENRTIKINDTIRVCLKNIKHEKKKFQCIASLV